MFDSISQDSFDDQGGASARAAGTRMRGGAACDEAPGSPRLVTTGRKNGREKPYPVDEETGERVQFVADRRDGITILRHLVPSETASPGVALIDALAFSLVPPEENSYVWLIKQMGQFLEIGPIEQRRGLFGFRYSARFGDGAGMIAWGGDSQRGRVYFSLMGQGCSMVKNWSELANWLEANRATIKRADVAYDDFEGKLVNIAWAVEQYKGDGFNAGGRKPTHSVFGDWLEGDASTKGRTLGIGNRASGKYARIYEKGKQLGEGTSPWTRIEVEWRAQDRFIPFDILTRPGHYLAGAYPCLEFLTEEQSTIKTVAKAGQIAYDTAVENAKRHCGKTVTLMLDVLGGDYGEVVNSLMRPGYPARIDPYTYHVKQNPAMLDRQLVGAS
ncbi:replication initiation factor domain-containing protein [Rhodoferax sp.]|uniref:replication initiation factor domain-containing protein n=1 Tax=Rhodoferax sp. TaxID=50421 RepID=UPI0026140CB8|nr:replication initiation factor domain-containing protein [Rhodoferax sp.]MDD2917683.1 replication initiation factor domain-containing protein [Rhodoferax sp.]